MNGAERIAAVRRSEKAAITLSQSYLTALNEMFPGERRKPERQRNPEFLELRRQIMEGNYKAFIARADQADIPERQPSGDMDPQFRDPKFNSGFWPGYEPESSTE